MPFGCVNAPAQTPHLRAKKSDKRMCTPIEKTARLYTLVLITTLVLGLAQSQGQIVTNWVAYNDHAPNYTPTNGWVTAPRVTTYDMGEAGASGNLTNFLDGQQLPVTLVSFHTGATHGF